MPSNPQQFSHTLDEVITDFRNEGVYGVLEAETGLSMDDIEVAAQHSPDGVAAPVAQVDAGLAFAAGLLVGLRSSNWHGDE